MKNNDKISIKEFVTYDYRTSDIFFKHGIDFCCNGNRSLKEVCEENNINIHYMLEKLNTILFTPNNNNMDFKSWPLDLLVDYIEKIHHTYIKEKIKVLLPALEKLCIEEGIDHPVIFEINTIFNDFMNELLPHMEKEELLLFPFIKEMVTTNNCIDTAERYNTENKENIIAIMQQEHKHEAANFHKISYLTHKYRAPLTASNSLRLTFVVLEEFERDLYKHIHLENNILFPRALAFAKELIPSN